MPLPEATGEAAALPAAVAVAVPVSGADEALAVTEAVGEAVLVDVAVATVLADSVALRVREALDTNTPLAVALAGGMPAPAGELESDPVPDREPEGVGAPVALAVPVPVGVTVPVPLLVLVAVGVPVPEAVRVGLRLCRDGLAVGVPEAVGTMYSQVSENVPPSGSVPRNDPTITYTAGHLHDGTVAVERPVQPAPPQSTSSSLLARQLKFAGEKPHPDPRKRVVSRRPPAAGVLHVVTVRRPPSVTPSGRFSRTSVLFVPSTGGCEPRAQSATNAPCPFVLAV